MRVRQRRAIGLFSAIFAVSLLAVVPTAASAAPVINFALRPASSCVGGNAHPDTDLALRWRSADGSLKHQVTVPVGQFGQWSYCSPSSVLEVGDTLRANDGVGQRTFTMPVFTLISDRVGDLFRGRAPAGSDLDLWYRAGLFADYEQLAEVVANSNGRWRHELDSDLLGGINASLFWTSPQGDTLETYGQAAHVTVTIGRSRVFGGVDGHQTEAIGLRGSGGALKGVATATGDDFGSFDSQFQNGGQPVTVAVGDRVRAPQMASDLDWIVPNIEGVADVPNDLVEGRCHDTGLYTDVIIVRVIRGGQMRGFTFAYPDSNGAFVADFGQPPAFFYRPANIRHGDKIQVQCLLLTGDWVQRFFAVP